MLPMKKIERLVDLVILIHVVITIIKKKKNKTLRGMIKNTIKLH